MLPSGLRFDVARDANAILTQARESGWKVGPVEWDNKQSRTVTFAAHKPGQATIYVLCAEQHLVSRLSKHLTPRT
jgi:hypothetical protein